MNEIAAKVLAWIEDPAQLDAAVTAVEKLEPLVLRLVAIVEKLHAIKPA